MKKILVVSALAIVFGYAGHASAANPTNTSTAADSTTQTATTKSSQSGSGALANDHAIAAQDIANNKSSGDMRDNSILGERSGNSASTNSFNVSNATSTSTLTGTISGNNISSIGNLVTNLSITHKLLVNPQQFC